MSIFFKTKASFNTNPFCVFLSLWQPFPIALMMRGWRKNNMASSQEKLKFVLRAAHKSSFNNPEAAARQHGALITDRKAPLEKAGVNHMCAALWLM